MGRRREALQVSRWRLLGIDRSLHPARVAEHDTCRMRRRELWSAARARRGFFVVPCMRIQPSWKRDWGIPIQRAEARRV